MLFSTWLRYWKRSLEGQSARKQTRRPRPPIRRIAFRPRLEVLEDRTLLSAYIVTTTADSGSGSLRDAINQINADTSHALYASPNNANVDEIDFNITAASDTGGGFNSTTGVAAIKPLSALPTITNAVILNGYSQPGASENTSTEGDNAVLKIELNGNQIANTTWLAGLTITADNSVVEGLDIHGFLASTNGFPSMGIWIRGGSNDHIQGNFIGTDISGIYAPDGLPNYSSYTIAGPMSYGVHVSDGAQNNWIGTDGDGVNDPAERNIISATGVGVALRGEGVNTSNGTYFIPAGGTSNNTVIAGNYIGTDRTGLQALGNWSGIATIQDSRNDRIGTNGTDTDVAGEGNVISGNKIGIIFAGGDTTIAAEQGCLVAGNLIGPNVNGSELDWNANGTPYKGNIVTGVGAAENSSNITIGGISQALGNTISYNTGPGVWLGYLRNQYATGIRVQGNAIHDNGGLGIDLGGTYPIPGPDGVTINDSQGHVGPNSFQNFPVLSSATSSSTGTFISGSFSEAIEQNTTITLDFYVSPTEDTSGHGQGETYLGSRTVYTDSSGYAPFNADFAVATANQYISATATDPQGNTSEFSEDVQASPSSQTFAQNLAAALPQSTTGSNTMVIQANPDTINDVVSGLSSSNLGSQVVPVSVHLNLASGTYQQQTVQVPQGMTLYINGVQGTTIDPASPAFTVTSGNVVVSNVTFVTTGDAPTILVTGGSLTLRNDVVQESTGYSDAAIAITGGAVDLGTATSPGGNTLNINGNGSFIQNTTSTPVTAIGSDFLVNGVALAPDSLSGIVFEDFNDDGQVDFGEKGIAGVAVALTGTDFLGNAVSMSTTTDSDGAYVFANLLPGSYSITETQPAGYTQGIDTVGTAGGSLTATDQFSVSLAQDAIGLNGLNYNFGEQPQATGSVKKGQTAGIGFWNNKNGQALIKSFNGGSTSTQLASWLAATLPHIFGVDAGNNALIHTDGSYFTNAEVAARFQQDFVLKGVKLDAQVLATALSVYATNATLDNTGVAANYGFIVSGDGVGTASVNVGSNGAAFGVANNSVLTVLDLLKATDAQAVGGLLYNGDDTLRKEANNVYNAINEEGNI